jgi:hypothetical protein
MEKPRKIHGALGLPTAIVARRDKTLLLAAFVANRILR